MSNGGYRQRRYGRQRVINTNEVRPTRQPYKSSYDILKENLLNDAENLTTSGVRPELFDGKRLIVSLTTFGKRLNEVSLSIESIMRGTVKPNKIVLWLDEKRKDEELPKALINQQTRGLEIRWVKDVGVCTKIYYPLNEFKDDYVCIVDDDHFYPEMTVEMLLKKTVETGSISAFACAFESANAYHFNTKKYPKNKFVEHGWGCLYPPNIFDDEALNLEKMLMFTKNNDDVWCHVQEVRLGLIPEAVIPYSQLSRYTTYNKEMEFGGTSLHSNSNNTPYRGWTEPYNNLMKYYGLL